MKLEVEIFKDNEDTYIWIGSENGSGAEYKANTPEEMGKAIAFYIETYCVNC